MVLKRFVKGIDQEAFFQKRVPENHPDFIDTATLHYARGTSAEEAVIRDAAGLAWVVNLGCLDLNPHPVRAEDLDHPDELRVDLDPMPGVDWSQIVDVAMVAREVLDDVGLVGWPKTSGSRGLHILVRIAPQWDFKQVRLAAETLAREVENRAPGLATRAMVEGGARRERVRRLQPERQGPHRRVGVLDPSAPRRAGVDAAGLGRGARAPARGVHGAHRARAVRRDRRSRTRASTTPSARSTGCSRSPKELGPAEKPPRGGDGDGRRQSTMPLIEVARTKTKPEALEALEQWKAQHPDRRRRCCIPPTCSSTACADRARSGTACG